MVPAYNHRAILDAAADGGLNIPRTVEATKIPVETVIAIFDGSRHVELSDLLAVAGRLEVSMTELWKSEPARVPVDFEILLKNRKRPFWRVVADESRPSGRGNRDTVTAAAGRV